MNQVREKKPDVWLRVDRVRDARARADDLIDWLRYVGLEMREDRRDPAERDPSRPGCRRPAPDQGGGSLAREVVEVAAAWLRRVARAGVTV